MGRQAAGSSRARRQQTRSHRLAEHTFSIKGCPKSEAAQGTASRVGARRLCRGVPSREAWNPFRFHTRRTPHLAALRWRQTLQIIVANRVHAKETGVAPESRQCWVQEPLVRFRHHPTASRRTAAWHAVVKGHQLFGAVVKTQNACAPGDLRRPALRRTAPAAAACRQAGGTTVADALRAGLPFEETIAGPRSVC